MKAPVVLLTTDTAQALTIRAALPNMRVLHCQQVEDVRSICQNQSVALVLIVDDPPRIDGREVFVELNAMQPGLSGILLVAGEPTVSDLQGALNAGFSGLVELLYAPEVLENVVQQALQRYQLNWDNTRLRTLIPLYRLGEKFFAANNEQKLVEELMQAVIEQTGASQISVMLYDTEDERLRIVAARGLDAGLVESIRVAPGEQIAGWVYKHGKPVILNKEDQHISMFADLLQQPELVTAISFPLRISERVIGVLNISQKTTEERFSSADKEMLSIVCSQAANALENLRSRQLLAQTTRMRTLFEQYVAPEVAELLLAQKTDLMELGEITEVTVLFADIRNFTRLVQHVELPLLRRFLNEFFSIFTETVFRYQGTVDKFMGDAVLSLFGAPVQQENPHLAAVQAAWMIRSRFRELQARWLVQSIEFAKVDLGVAVTCGPLFIGNIGSDQRLDYTVIGNAVNFAQRLAAESTECCIYITQPVRDAVESDFSVTPLGDMQLRGVEKKISVYAVCNQHCE